MSEYLDEVMRSLVLILRKRSRYVKTGKDGDKDKNKNIKLVFLHIDDKKLLEKYKIIFSKIEDSKISELDNLPVYDDRYIKLN